jgi:uncharacterized Zn finger protein
MKKISSVRQLLSPDFIEAHALPSNIMYGDAICNRGAVSMIDCGDTRVEAWVGGLDGKMIEGGGSRRRVEFTISENGLEWHCTGNPKDHQIFCKHCVALAREILKQ